MSLSTNNNPYGVGDKSYLAAGGESGLLNLCSDFYHIMDTLPTASHIRGMHKADLFYMRDRLALFLCAWLGGPRDWFLKNHYPAIPELHKIFIINEDEKQSWLICMDQAIEKQNWDEDFKEYLAAQFRVPAEVVRRFSKS